MYLFPYKPHWLTDYLLESEAIVSSYGTRLELHHIGSTAIPGLYAKDCIDILGVVPNILEVEAKKPALKSLGFTAKGTYGIEGRAYFSKANRKVHLHIFEAGDSHINEHLGFVKLMFNNKQLINELNVLKCELQNKYPNDKELYQRDKTFFYEKLHQRLMNQAGQNDTSQHNN